MRIGIVGYGKMGTLIRANALNKGHQVPVIVDPASKAAEVTHRDLPLSAAEIDVIIDFSHPTAALNNIEHYTKLGTAAVIGTTGWYDKMDQVASLVESSGIGLIWSGNFSLGVNLFFQILKNAGSIMNRFPQYDVMVHEFHHRHKAESPSGTAEMIGKILLNSLDRKSSIIKGSPHQELDSSELHISSTRGGAIPGLHQVVFDSENDTLVFEHTARNRYGFVEGAVTAAEWICKRRGFYDLDQMMQSLIGGEKIG